MARHLTMVAAVLTAAALVTAAPLASPPAMGGQSQARHANASTTPGPLKPVVGGLTTMGPISWTRDDPSSTSAPSIADQLNEARTHPNTFNTVVVQAAWKTLEPNAGVFHFASITGVLNSIAAYNASHTVQVDAKLRVIAGRYAPGWALALSGGSVQVADDQTPPGSFYTVGKFWTQDYMDAFAGLQQALATAFDDPTNPNSLPGASLVGSVAATGCSSVTDEIFLLPLATTASKANLIAAGFTDAAVQTCLLDSIDTYHTYWKDTPVDFPVSIYRHLAADGTVTADSDGTGFPLTFTSAVRNAFSDRAILSNHGLQTQDLTSPSLIRSLVCKKSKNRSTTPYTTLPLAFQTVNPTAGGVFDPNNPDDTTAWDNAIAAAASWGATEIEFWDTKDAGGPANVTTAQLTRYASQVNKHTFQGPCPPATN